MICTKMGPAPLVMVILILGTMLARAQSYVVLHRFNGPDGSMPSGALMRDGSGNLYGTTLAGGAHGHGTVFKINVIGQESVLHSFTSADGSQPSAGLVRDSAGNLYGTTRFGGLCNLGTVFKLDTTGRLTTLHSFTGKDLSVPDGSEPLGELLRDASGNLYGTTFTGGTGACVPQLTTHKSCGIVFKLDTTGKETVLHNFTGDISGGADGGEPKAGLISDGAGNLYGTTFVGGSSGGGTVFKLDATGKITVLHNFTGIPDGAFPVARLVRDASGNLYGTTTAPSFGSVFKLNSTGQLVPLHKFTAGADGAFPFAGVTRDTAGNLYGTTNGGGFVLVGTSDSGTVYKVDATEKETVLHSFSGGTEGDGPLGALILDTAGNLYSTTEFGGTLSCLGGSGCGVVFKFTP